MIYNPVLNGWDYTDWPQVTSNLGLGTSCELGQSYSSLGGFAWHRGGGSHDVAQSRSRSTWRPSQPWCSPTMGGSLVCGSQSGSTIIQVLIQVTSIVRVSVEYGWVSLGDVACHMDSVFPYPHVSLFQRHKLLSRFVTLKIWCGSSNLPQICSRLVNGCYMVEKWKGWHQEPWMVVRPHINISS